MDKPEGISIFVAGLLLASFFVSASADEPNSCQALIDPFPADLYSDAEVGWPDLKNGVSVLRNITYTGVVEGILKDRWAGSVGDQAIWAVPIDVPQNASRVGVMLRWDDPESDLALLLFNPKGKPVDISYGSGDPEEAGASHPVEGLWQVLVYGFSVPDGRNQTFELDATLNTRDTWSWVSASGPPLMESGSEGNISATITVPKTASSRGLDRHIEIRTANDSFSIPVSLIMAGATLSGASETELLDPGRDGYFDRLCIRVGANVTVPGDYRLEGNLVDGSGTALLWLRETKHLEEDGEIEVCVNGSEIWKIGGCGPLTLKDIFLYNKKGEIIDRSDEEMVIKRCPEDFQPASSSRFTGRFVDETHLGGTKSNMIAIGVEVSIQTLGAYQIGGRLVDDNGFEIDRVEKTAVLVQGTQNVSLEFNPIKFMMKQKRSKLHLRDLSLKKEGMEIDWRDRAWSTAVLGPEEFTTKRETFVIS